MQWLLSQEVNDIVVDLAVDDEYSLDNFALMCRSMLHRTRQHRFRHATISISPSSDSCQKLHDILLSSEGIRPYVKSVFLKGPSPLDLMAVFAQPSWGATKYAALVSLTKLLPALEEFHVKHFSRTNLPHEFGSQLKKCTRINRITLHNVAFSSYSILASILRAFPNLKALRLKLVSGAVDSGARSEVQDDVVVPTIKALDVDLSEELVVRICGDICEGTDTPLSVAQLHTLRIGCFEISHLNHARSIVQKSASTLRNLQLGYIQTDVAGLDILRLPSLKHLHIHLNDFEEDKDVDALRWWIRCFETAAANSVCLEKITITLRASSNVYFDMAPYHASDITTMLPQEYEDDILANWFNIRKPDTEISEDNVWCELDTCLPALTGELVIVFTGEGSKIKESGDGEIKCPFKKRVNRLKEIIGGGMNRFKKGGGVLAFELMPAP
ncbi:hypothetical protein F5146DRAFT_1145982 [Armillaria mellea]|nr:hypothetical protein F5146DRAFT_1145982 [Armillaria mellea]